MTNPNNAVGTPAAFSGRTSVKAFNNITGAFTSGLISGWACAPVSGPTVAVGGNAGTRDIAVAEDASGNRTTISNISEAPIEVVMGSSPATYNRIDAIVAYVEPSPTGDNSTQDNPVACGIIPVAGTAAANPDQPTDAQIRAAITTDGGTGASAYYCILTLVKRNPGQTTITTGDISMPKPSVVVAKPAVETARAYSNTTIPISTTNYTVIPIEHKAGDKDILKVEQNSIVIPEGITQVKASAYFNVWVASSGTSTFNTFPNIELVRGGTVSRRETTPWLFESNLNTTMRNPIIIPPTVLLVQPGDRIRLTFQVYSGPSSTAVVVHGDSFLTVEEC